MAKILSLLSLSLFSLVLFTAFASAAILTVSKIDSPSTINHDAGSFNIVFDLTNEGAEATTLNWDYTASHGATISFSQDILGEGTTTEPNTESITATVTFDDKQNGDIQIDISGDASGSGGEFTLDPIEVSINDSPELDVSSATISQGQDSTSITL